MDVKIAGSFWGNSPFKFYKLSTHSIPSSNAPSSALIELEVALDSNLLVTKLPRDIPRRLNFDLVRDWLQDCAVSHSRCSLQGSRILPTRLLDVEIIEKSQKPRLIVTKYQQRPIHYLTLSHHWTESSKTQATTRDNLAQRLQEMSLNSLSQTFRDAIYITRQLGYRYIWIDSLCIVQDDGRDWERESKNMSSIFEASDLTLSALCVSTSSDGLIAPDRGPERFLNVKVGDDAVIGIRRPPRTLTEAVIHSEMDKRAWIFQERLLSPRILHFGDDQMHWECCTCLAAETGDYDLHHEG